MREIHLARLDKVRPCLVLTREAVRPYRTEVTVAGITRSDRGLSTKVRVGADGGIDVPSFINMDDIQTISTDNLIRFVGVFPDEREPELTAAVLAAFDLE
jgi:mRNA interferase MazF